MAPSKKDSKRVEAARKAAETRRKNRIEHATEATRPVGAKPTVAEARATDTTPRTAGLAVDKSGPSPAATDPARRSSPEAQQQAQQQSSLPEPNAEQVADARDRANVEAGRLAASRSQDQRVAPTAPKEALRDQAHEQRLKAMEEWNAPRRAQVTTAVAAVDGEVAVFTADGSVFLDTRGERRLTHTQTADLVKQLQAAYQAVS